MARLGPTLLSAAVLVATALAFAVSERYKLEPSPILRPDVTAAFSPACHCPTRRAHVAFTLRRGGDVSIAIVDGAGKTVAKLLSRRHFARGDRAAAAWDGSGAADGSYRPRIELGRRTIVMPNRIALDTHPPKLTLQSVSTNVISPDGDGRNDVTVVTWAVSEPARTALYVGNRRFELVRGHPLTGTFRWNGKVRGRRVPRGKYALLVRSTDVAGNRAAPVRALVRVRFVELSRDVVRAKVRTRFGVRVLSDARSLSWSFARRHGRTRPGLLVLRAPKRPGRYVLRVSEHGHGASASVRVSRR